MVNGKQKYLQLVAGFITAMTILVACQNSNSIFGKWQETNGKAIFEFREDYTFSTVDNMGMQVDGKYNLDGHNNIRFEILHKDSKIETIDANITVAMDELIFKFPDTGEVEKYRRIRP